MNLFFCTVGIHRTLNRKTNMGSASSTMARSGSSGSSKDVALTVGKIVLKAVLVVVQIAAVAGGGC